MQKAWETLKEVAGEEVGNLLYRGKPVSFRAVNGSVYELSERFGTAKVMNVTSGRAMCRVTSDFMNLPIADQYIILYLWVKYAPNRMESVDWR